MAKLTDIESIGEVCSTKLEDAGIASVENLQASELPRMVNY